jgi:hypothetical protein
LVTDVEQPAVADGDEAAQRHLPDDLRALAGSGLAYAKAELALQKARAGFAASRIKWVALLGLGALLFVFFALIALTVGMVISLATLIGPLAATAVVFVALALLALVCGLIAAGQWKRMVAVLSGEDKQ